MNPEIYDTDVTDGTTVEGVLVDDVTITEDAEVVQDPTSSIKPTKSEMVRALAAAVANGSLTKEQAGRMRADLGISQAIFTRKQPTRATRKAKRKAQKVARRVNRK